MSGRNRNTYRLPLIQPHLRTWPATQTCVLTGNQTSDPAACRTTPSSLSHTSQGASSLSIPLLSITKCLYCCNSLITDLFVSTHIVFLLVPWHCQSNLHKIPLSSFIFLLNTLHWNTLLLPVEENSYHSNINTVQPQPNFSLCNLQQPVKEMTTSMLLPGACPQLECPVFSTCSISTYFSKPCLLLQLRYLF